MSAWYDPVMFVLFAVHLVPMLIIGIKRRELYYLAPITTFALLTAAFGLRLFAPELQVGSVPLHQPVRYIAWAAAAVSIPTPRHSTCHPCRTRRRAGSRPCTRSPLRPRTT